MNPPPPAARRIPVPSRRLVWALALAGAAAALAPLVPPFAIVWRALAALLFLLVILDLAVLRPRRGAVIASRAIADLHHLGRKGSYALTLRNATGRAFRVSFREGLPAALEGEPVAGQVLLAPHAEAAAEVSFVGLRRGEHELPPPGLRLSHPWGLLEYQETAPLVDIVAVSPGRPAAETKWLLSRAAVLEDAGERRVRRAGAAREFESLREYVIGDEVRAIDWKASARRQRPQVRQYQTERNAEVVLALDCGRLMASLIGGVPKLDLAMTPLLDVAAVALQRGDRVGFLAFDSRPRAFLPPRGGLRQLEAMIAALGRLPSGLEPTSYLRAVRHLEARHRKRSFILVFTDFTDELTAQEMYASLSALTRRHVIVFVAVGDPHLDQIFRHPARSSRALFEKAVAGQLLVERRRALARIERLGIATVDAEPRRLSGPLLGKFLEVRLKGVL